MVQILARWSIEIQNVTSIIVLIGSAATYLKEDTSITVLIGRATTCLRVQVLLLGWHSLQYVLVASNPILQISERHSLQ